jgi:uncharacterized protein (TIGR04255 family)
LKSKRYKSAPIHEAVIEIRIQPPESLDLPALTKLTESLRSDFPKQVPMHLVQMGIAAQDQPEKGFSPSFSQAPFGFRISKSDESRILQIRREGLAYSHMAPYTEWAVFRAETLPLWGQFRAVCPDAKLTRCALRYINRVDIPETTIELHDYFTFYPKMPDGLPQQDMVGMTLNVQMPQRDIECMATLNLIQVDPVNSGYLSFVLDIDVFRLGIESWKDADVWVFLDRLRDRKNEIFEACITDRTRELIDR